MSEENRIFNPREHLMQLKSKEGDKDYLPVQWRLVWFREQCPQGIIETEMVHLNLTQAVTKEVPVWNSEKRRSDRVLKEAPGIALFRAKVSDGRGGVATGYGSESALDFGDFIEKAETKAIGRALAALGYGTQFAPELDEGARIVDAPVDRTPVASGGNGSNRANSSTAQRQTNGNSAPRDENAEASVTEQQVASIRKLCQYLYKDEPANVTSISYLAAKKLIGELTTEYKEDKPATAEMRASVRQMCQKLNNKQPPANWEQMKFQAMKRLLERLTGEYSDMVNANNGHAPSVKELQKRCAQLKPPVIWDELVTRKLGSNKPDDNIIPEERIILNRALNIIEENRLKKAVDQQKAS